MISRNITSKAHGIEQFVNILSMQKTTTNIRRDHNILR